MTKTIPAAIAFCCGAWICGVAGAEGGVRFVELARAPLGLADIALRRWRGRSAPPPSVPPRPKSQSSRTRDHQRLERTAAASTREAAEE